MSDYFPRYTMKPNPQCENEHCIKAQEDYERWVTENPPTEVIAPEKKPLHEDNEWGISVVDNSDDEPLDEGTGHPPPGTSFAFERSNEAILPEDTVQVSEEEDLSSLMSQLASLKSSTNP